MNLNTIKNSSDSKNKEFKIVCLDDERDIVDLYEAYILKYGFSPVKFLDPRKALEYIKKEGYCVKENVDTFEKE